MISKNTINSMIHKLHLGSFIESQKELLRDNKGGFLIPISTKVKDGEYSRYGHLPINWSLSPITKNDLPEEFSRKAVATVDMFRRKTYDLECECLIYFDIHTGNIVSCNFSDEEPDKVNADIYGDALKDMHIASIHNHPNPYYSPPSGKNFEMLGIEFEEYELTLSKNELWILESKEVIFSSDEINVIRKSANDYFDFISEETSDELEKGYLIIDNIDCLYGDFLLDYLNNDFDNIN